VETPAVGAKPAARRRTATPSEPKNEPSTPAIVRHQGGSRAAIRRAPAEVAEPDEAAKPDAETGADEAKPAPRRRAATPSEPKNEPSTPAIIRHQGGSRPALRKPPAEAAKPVEATRPADTKPAAASNTVPATPASVPDDRLRSYLESGAPAKPPEVGSRRPEASTPQLNSYATSGDTAGAKATSAGAAGGSRADEPKGDAVPSQNPAPE
jgi:hypothetical protein